MRVLAHDQVREQRKPVADVGQVVERAHRHVDLVGDALDVEQDLRRVLLQQGPGETADHRVVAVAIARAPARPACGVGKIGQANAAHGANYRMHRGPHPRPPAAAHRSIARRCAATAESDASTSGSRSKQLGAGRMQIGHHHRRHAGGRGGDDAGLRILQDDAVAGRNTEPLGGGKENVGRGLASRDLVAADQRSEAMQQSDTIELGARALAPRRGRDRGGDAALVEQIQDVIEPGLERDPFGGDDRVVIGRPGAGQCVDRIVGPVPVADQRDAIAEAASDHLAAELEVELAAQAARGALPCAQRRTLGVEHQAVHVEDDGLRPALDQRMRPLRTR